MYRDHADHRLTAISLYNLRYNEAREAFVHVENNHAPYIYQQPQSWGAVFLPEPWRQYTRWMETFPDGQDPVVPDSLTNRWPYRQVRLLSRSHRVLTARADACFALPESELEE